MRHSQINKGLFIFKRKKFKANETKVNIINIDLKMIIFQEGGYLIIKGQVEDPCWSISPQFLVAFFLWLLVNSYLLTRPTLLLLLSLCIQIERTRSYHTYHSLHYKVPQVCYYYYKKQSIYFYEYIFSSSVTQKMVYKHS